MQLIKSVPIIVDYLISEGYQKDRLLTKTREILEGMVHYPTSMKGYVGKKYFIFDTVRIEISTIDDETWDTFVSEVRKTALNAFSRQKSRNTEILKSSDLFEKYYFLLSENRLLSLLEQEPKKFSQKEIQNFVEIHKRHFKTYVKSGQHHTFIDRLSPSDTRKNLPLSLKQGSKYYSHMVRYCVKERKDIFYRMVEVEIKHIPFAEKLLDLKSIKKIS